MCRVEGMSRSFLQYAIYVDGRGINSLNTRGLLLKGFFLLLFDALLQGDTVFVVITK